MATLKSDAALKITIEVIEQRVLVRWVESLRRKVRRLRLLNCMNFNSPFVCQIEFSGWTGYRFNPGLSSNLFILGKISQSKNSLN